MPRSPLPVDDALPRLLDALRATGSVVLRAPAGAGKTTRVPPAILDAGLAGQGQVLLLEPRRVAARAAARRIAEERGATLGGEVGWHVRFDRKASRGTRILALTEGLLLRRLQDDPYLEDVGAVIFDEFHERSLATDVSLAMVHRLQREARPDLRIVVMSATVETAPVAAYLGAPIVESDGFLHPVEVRHLERPDTRWIQDQTADGVRRALAATTGDVLAFLPGVGEIRGTAGKLGDLAGSAGIDVVELYGDLPPERQDAALRRGPRRRVILATNVAETSVTVEGVTAVVDSGLARVQRFDPAAGLDRLVLTQIAKSSIIQRTGRAGRTAPGICFRLWTANEERTFPERLEPEVRRVDLAGSALELLAWGETDLTAFPWFEPPDAARLASALDLLERLGATSGGRITPLGQTMVRLPVHPRLARMLAEGHRLGHPARTAWAAAMLSERDPMIRSSRPRIARHHSDSDVLDILDLMSHHTPQDAAVRAAGNVDAGSTRWIKRVTDQLIVTTMDELGDCPAIAGRGPSGDEVVMRALLAGYPDRLARRRAPGDRRAVLVTGRGVRLADESSVADAELFVCVDVDGGSGPEALVRKASAVRREWLDPARMTTRTDIEFDGAADKVVAFRRTRFDELVLDEHAAALPSRDDGDDRPASILAEAAARDLTRALDLGSPELVGLRTRVACLREHMPDAALPALDDDALRAALPDLCVGLRSFEELRRAPVAAVLRARLDRRQLATLDREAPERITVPSGSQVPVRYDAGRAPVVAVRIQEIFGLADTPRLAGGRVQVTLELLGPNRQPQQVTNDLRSFWANTYPEVRKELKRRYPRHSWPEDPWTAPPEHRPARRRRG